MNEDEQLWSLGQDSQLVKHNPDLAIGVYRCPAFEEVYGSSCRVQNDDAEAERLHRCDFSYKSPSFSKQCAHARPFLDTSP